MKKVKLPKYPTLYAWEHNSGVNSIYIWYPDGHSELLCNDGTWEDAGNSFKYGPLDTDIKICEIKD